MSGVNWDDYDHFSKWEFDCKETGENEMKQAFMDRLQALRYELDAPIIVNSGYRSPRHSLEAAKAGGPGPHSTGRAADFKVGPGVDAYRFVELAMRFGFTGIGVSQREGQPRFIHLDMLDRIAIWSY